MFRIQLNHVTKFYYNKTVLQDICAQIHQGDKIGIIGRNGIGKTTLARIIIGEERPDTGTVEYDMVDPLLVYLSQQPQFQPGSTTYHELYQAVREGQEEEASFAATTKKMLYQAGIPVSMWMQEAQTLSGGEKTKLMLCKILVKDFDLLILDEPTNHLDLQSIAWLQSVIQRLKQTVMIISHNRALLDHTINRVWEISSNGLRIYRGNYCAYKKQKELEFQTELARYEKQQAKIHQLKEMIRTRKSWLVKNQAAHSQMTREKSQKQIGAIKAKEKELERLLQQALPKPHFEPIPAFGLLNKKEAEHKKLASMILRAQHIHKQFDQKAILSDISIIVERGDKIAIMGQNGVGKSTLLKILCGMDTEYSGKIEWDRALRIGYFSQEMNQLQDQSTMMEYLLTEDVSVQDIRTLLGCLLFRRDDVYKKVAHLSMGEKSRLVFAKLILCQANLLILDEPTNYLDIAATEKVEQVLCDYTGSLLMVSHDEYLVQKVANKVFCLENQRLIDCGEYEDYSQKRKWKNLYLETPFPFTELLDQMLLLECERSYLAGKLAECSDETEKNECIDAYMNVSGKQNILRQVMENKN